MSLIETDIRLMVHVSKHNTDSPEMKRKILTLPSKFSYRNPLLSNMFLIHSVSLKHHPEHAQMTIQVT